MFSQVNTFQAHVLHSSDTSESMVIFLYPEGGINWTTGDGDGGVNGVGGDPARVELTSPLGNLVIPDSGTDDIIDIETQTNVDIPGVLVFRVDTNFLERKLLYHKLVSYSL